MTVLVTGATGLLGRQVVQRLLDTNHEVRVMVRSPGRERVLHSPPTDVFYGDVSDPNALTEACRDISEVIHLVAVIRGNRRQFDAINRQGTANVVTAAKASGSVRRFIHVSANGATNTPRLQYLHSKWLGEQAVVTGGIPYVILRPSLIFGPGDEFTSAVAALAKITPITPMIGSGNNRLQPIHVDDVARCVVGALTGDVKSSQIVEIGGPQQLTYNEIVATVAHTVGRSGRTLNIPLWMIRPGIALLGALTPNPPINKAMLQLISLRNVAEIHGVEQHFGFQPRRLAGNIDHVKDLTIGAALRMNLGFSPRRRAAA